MSLTSRFRNRYFASITGVPEGAHVDTAHDGLADTTSGVGDAARWASVRKQQPVNVLLPGTTRWMDTLPIEVRPSALAREFPRLANRMAVDWDTPDDCNAFIYELLLDRRSARHGFSPAVLQDILQLRIHYAELHPVPDGIWTVDAE